MITKKKWLEKRRMRVRETQRGDRDRIKSVREIERKEENKTEEKLINTDR